MVQSNPTAPLHCPCHNMGKGHLSPNDVSASGLNLASSRVEFQVPFEAGLRVNTNLAFTGDLKLILPERPGGGVVKKILVRT
ncbi:MAG: hypothetical protein WCG34_07340 [Leptolinea sp.]